MKVTTYCINKGTASQYFGLKNDEENTVLHYTPTWKTEKVRSVGQLRMALRLFDGLQILWKRVFDREIHIPLKWGIELR